MLASINRVLNKNVENHKSELAAISFPWMEDNYSQYESLDSVLVKEINSQKEKCLTLIDAYKEKIKQKIGNIYTPILITPNGLKAEITTFNALLVKLKEKIAEFNNAISRRKKIIVELTTINKEIAHFDVLDLYRSYTKQDKDKKTQEQKVNKAHQGLSNRISNLAGFKVKKIQYRVGNL